MLWSNHGSYGHLCMYVPEVYKRSSTFGKLNGAGGVLCECTMQCRLEGHERAPWYIYIYKL